MKNGKYVNLDGDIFWYKNGKLHREDGPAAEYIEGMKYWYVNGKLHREGGPAQVDPLHGDLWFLDHCFCPKLNVFLVALSKSLDLSEFYK